MRITKRVTSSDLPIWLNKIIFGFSQKGIELSVFLKDEDNAFIIFEKHFSIFGKMEITAIDLPGVDDGTLLMGNGSAIGSIQAVSPQEFVNGCVLLMDSILTPLNRVFGFKKETGPWEQFIATVKANTPGLEIPTTSTPEEITQFYFDLIDTAPSDRVDTTHYVIDAVIDLMKTYGVDVDRGLDNQSLHIIIKDFIEGLTNEKT